MNKHGPIPQGAQLQLNMKDVQTSPNAVCERCGKAFVVPLWEIKIVSPILNPTGKEILVPMQIGWKCASCKKVWKKFKPKKKV